MKKKNIHLFLVGVIMLIFVHGCEQEEVALSGNEENIKSLLVEAKCFFEKSISNQINNDSLLTQKGLLPLNYTPLWDEANLFVEATTNYVNVPITTYESFYAKNQLSKEKTLIAQTLVFQKESHESKCFILSLLSMDTRASARFIDHFLEDRNDVFFTGIVWYTSLDGNLERLEVYKDGVIVLNSLCERCVDIENCSFFLDYILVKESHISRYSSSEGDGGGSGDGGSGGVSPFEYCPRCCVLKAYCECCIHYPFPSKKKDCKICGTSDPSKPNPTRCHQCGNLIKNCTCSEKDKLLYCQNCGAAMGLASGECSVCGYKNK